MGFGLGIQNRGKQTGRRGLTLLELVVVLAILVAIGGLVVPLLGNYLHRANIASCTVNIPEMDKWIQTYVNLYSSYPDRMDNLAVGANLASYVAAGDYEGATPPESIQAAALSAGDAAALKEAGITTLCNLVEDAGGDWNPTFWPYGADRATAPATTAVASGVNVATLTATGIKLMGLPASTANYKYVIFGLNTPCTLFRNIAEEAPYHFADTPSEDPATFYMAFGAVFMVRGADGSDTNSLESAKYMGTIAFHDFGLSTAGMHTQEWWSRLKDERPNL